MREWSRRRRTTYEHQWSVNGIRERLLSRLKVTSSGCWEWTGSITTNGYAETRWRRQHYRVHQLAWKLFRGPIPKGMNVLHSCDNRICFNWLDHLFIGSQRDNIRDAMAKGRWVNPPRVVRLGEANHFAVLKIEEVRYIKAMKGSKSVAQLAQELEISKGAIYSIFQGRNWSWVNA